MKKIILALALILPLTARADDKPKPKPPDSMDLLSAARINNYIEGVKNIREQCVIVVLTSDPFVKASKIAASFDLHLTPDGLAEQVDVDTGKITRPPSPTPPPQPPAPPAPTATSQPTAPAVAGGPIASTTPLTSTAPAPVVPLGAKPKPPTKPKK